MACNPPVFLRTFDESLHGVRTVVCNGDGYTVTLEWYKEYLQPSNWTLVYNLYWSTDQANIYSEGVKFTLKPNTTNQYLSMDLHGYFDVGKVYYFAVKGAGHEPGTLLFDQLPNGGDPGLKIYPEAALVRDISATDMIIPLDDVSMFPPSGIVLIGAELIKYSNVDFVDGYLIVEERGAYGYQIAQHTMSGNDGYSTAVWNGPATDHSVVDLLLTNDAVQNFPSYVFNGLASDSAYLIEMSVTVDGYGKILKIVDGYDGYITNREGPITFTIQAQITTDGYGFATVEFITSPAYSVSIGLAGANIISSAGGYTVQVQRTPGITCYANYSVKFTQINDQVFDDPFVHLWRGWEDSNTAIGMATIRFDEQYARILKDGYGFRERTDILSGTSNLTVVDNANAGFPIYDQTGWDRTFMPDYLSGKCVGTYFGGEYGCADGNDVGGAIRGLSIQDHMNMREEYLLQITGEPVVLFRRMWSGKQSQHTSSTRENTTYRGIDTYGTSLVTGYEQFFSPRRSDGKILVRFGPTKEDFKREEPGIENLYIPNCWTLVIPTIKDGDFIIRFNQDGSEEWRYEIIDVDRNRSLLTESGAQKFTAVRVRKTDPLYQVRSIRDTSTMPSELLTSIGMVSGPGGIPPHMHHVVIDEHILSISQINQLTSVDQGHNHPVQNGIVGTVLGHTHQIIL